MDAERRAEARRRARLMAQGRLDAEVEEEVLPAPARPPAGSFLQRIFPPVAPLPGKPDPLEGFSYNGGRALRPIALGLWLIRQNLYASLGMGVLWAACSVVFAQDPKSMVGTVASLAAYGSLFSAGWIGWRRPWVYGLVAAVFGWILYAGWFIYSLSSISGLTKPLPSALFVSLAVNAVLQAAIPGAIFGFYGGYLRRRLRDPATRQATPARRRR